jgi:meso-butanediol dehydrogenase/(S,S)-butanediol dehydrogenase/diacetyl reductase
MRLRMAKAIWRTAIVTGAASGIGRSFAETLAAAGTAVGLLDVSAEQLAHVADTIRSKGGRVHTRVADVSSANEVDEAVPALVTELGGLDLLVNCAAIPGAGHFMRQSAEEFERVIRVDLFGTINILRATLPALRQSQGAAVCIASTAAVHGWPALVAYSAAKFGVAGFCDAVRAELAHEGICLTAVFPLLIDTPLLKAGDVAPILKQGRPVPPETVVRKTLAAVTWRRPRVFVPGSVRLIAALHGLAPSLLDWYGRWVGFRA